VKGSVCLTTKAPISEAFPLDGVLLGKLKLLIIY
jgi:hypothetical protein